MKYHVRRIDREIKDPAKLERVLKETRYITIALSKDNVPYLVSLSHSYDEEAKCLYFHCASAGKKLDYMRSNPRVWGQAIIDRGYVDGECNHLYVTTMFEGRIELVEDIPEKRRIMSYLFTHQERGSEVSGSRVGEVDPHLVRIGKDAELRSTTVGRIILDGMTGKHSKDTEY
jgi:nitroimidazol reductase NimA-like FMN-containing flavoprotein (pyridoxamine 5'-phosphate oxidase superfamily)